MTEEEMFQRMTKVISGFLTSMKERAENQLAGLRCNAADLCRSPIEETFFLAWSMLMKERELVGSPRGGGAEYRFFAPDFAHPPKVEPWDYADPFGVRNAVWERNHLAAQVPVGPYTADFILARGVYEDRGFIFPPMVVVECDGHDFHERTKEQAAHDKARDRFFATQGFHVMRFTGSELFRDPANCAEEVDEFFEEHIAKVCCERNKQPTK